MTDVSSHDYHVVMTKIGIAELKSRLSHYLRAVARGGTVAVYDRDRPVARIIPFVADTPLQIRPPVAGAPRPGDIAWLPPLGLGSDVVALLMEERGDR